MKSYFVFIFFVLCIGMVLADSIEDTTIYIKVYNQTLEIVNTDYSANNKNIPLNITNDSVIFQEQDFPILFIKNESVDSSLVDKYTECISLKGTCESEKAQFNMGWNNCINDLNECNSQNNQTLKDQLNSCNLEKERLKMELDSEREKTKGLEDEQKSTGSSKVIWGIGGLIMGFVAYGFYIGKFGNQQKDKSQDEFNPVRGY